ncbi:MAG TPA: TraY domain-containing protein [Phycisphaerae bacterium]|nr:TraY domain-containing protein [Phycisphaerae bacterium]
MPDILIRGLDRKILHRLKDKAKRNGRSLQKEAKDALEQAAGLSYAEFADLSHHWQRKLNNRKFADSARLLREDRRR